MKTAFAIDFLLERTPEVFLLELLLAGHEDADIYCLAHASGMLQGEVERHRIISSPLSRFVRAPADLPGKAWLLPSAARQVVVAPDVDELVIISSGWAHAFRSGPRTARHVWMYRWDDPATRPAGWQKFFRFHHERAKRAALSDGEVAFSSRWLADSLGRAQAPVLAPALKTEEFFVVPDDKHPGTYPHHLVMLEGTDPAWVRALIGAARAAGAPLKFLGQDDEYAAEKALGDPLLDFVGDHCEATTAAFTHGARAVWALGEGPFPAEALGALCCGRPVVVRDTPVNREFLGPDGVWYADAIANLGTLLARVERDYLGADKRVLRRHGLKWNERLFKSQLRAFAGLTRTPRPSSLLK